MSQATDVSGSNSLYTHHDDAELGNIYVLNDEGEGANEDSNEEEKIYLPPDEWAGIEGVQPHPDGDARGGKKPQGKKDRGENPEQTALEDFEKQTGGEYVEIEDEKLRGTGPHGENLIFNPESSGGPDGTKGNIPIIYVNGGALRYE